MKKLFLLSLFALILFIFNTQAQTNFPYLINGEVGSKTILSVQTGSGKSIGTQTVEILEKNSVGDTSIMKIQNVFAGMGSLKSTYIVKSYGDTSYIELKDYLNLADKVKYGITTISPEWLIFPAEMTAEQDLIGYETLRDGSSYKEVSKMKDRKVVGVETVSTEAGDFECVKITYTIESTNNYGVFTTKFIDWYNKEIGLVKQEGYTGSGRLENTFILKSIDIK